LAGHAKPARIEHVYAGIMVIPDYVRHKSEEMFIRPNLNICAAHSNIYISAVHHESRGFHPCPPD
jgi:hypothetical protein